MILYNLFPPLAGKFTGWSSHLDRAKAMGFDWVFVNPVQRPGFSGSLYSIADYFDVNPRFVDPEAAAPPFDQLRSAIARARQLGLRLMTDLVINHCAVDAPLTREHPEWFIRENGELSRAFCVQEDGTKVVWRDLARFDHEHTTDPEGLFEHWVKVVEHLLDLGFSGFRCDAAYQIPAESWQRLIRRIKRRSADAVFAAETLGCRPEQTLSTAAAGFDWIFNSSKWWDYESPWLRQQYELTRKVAPSIGFPESHDTERLFAESGGSEAALKQRYLFTALFSTGVMIPIGFEYGFRKRLHVVDTSPADWESPNVEITEFIRSVNQLKRFTVFAEECELEFVDADNPRILVMHKRCSRSGQEGLVLLNKDTDRSQQVRVESFSRYLKRRRALRSVLPDRSLPPITEPFEHTLGPGAAVVLVSDPMQELQPTECR